MKKNLWKVGTQGQLGFRLREDHADNNLRPDTFWEHTGFAIAIMLICGTLDAVLFYQLFSSILYDHPAVRFLSVIGCLVGFDVIPICLGILVRKHEQGFRIKLWLMALLFAGFVLALTGNIWLRIVMRDLVLPAQSSSATSFIGAVSLEDAVNPGALPFAVFSSLLPVVTSIASFGVSYITFNPLKTRMVRLRKEQVALEDAISQVESTLVEYDTNQDFEKQLMAIDDAQYENALGMLKEHASMYCDYVRERIKEQLGDPAATNELSKDIHQEICERLNGEGKSTAPKNLSLIA